MATFWAKTKLEPHVQCNGDFIIISYHVFLRPFHIYIIYMLILRFIRINVVHCPFSRVCNKVATKINYVLDHHEFVCQNLN